MHLFFIIKHPKYKLQGLDVFFFRGPLTLVDRSGQRLLALSRRDVHAIMMDQTSWCQTAAASSRIVDDLAHVVILLALQPVFGLLDAP